MAGQNQQQGNENSGLGRQSNRGNQGRGNQGSNKDKTKTKRSHLFHPKSTTSANCYPYNETLFFVVSKLRTQDQFSEAPTATDSIEALVESPPEKPEEPTKLYKGTGNAKEMYYGEVELSNWKSDLADYRSSLKKHNQAMWLAAALIFDKYCTAEMKLALTGLNDFSVKV